MRTCKESYMNILKNLILASLMPMLLFGGAEEKTLKEARIDVKTGFYHLATVRLESLLKEYPESEHRSEMLQLIIKSYVLSKREQEAIPYIRIFLKEFPNESGSLDPKYLSLLSALPEAKAAEPVPEAAAPPSPPGAVVEKAPPASEVKVTPEEKETPATGIEAPPVQEPAGSELAGKPQAQPEEKVEEKAPQAVSSPAVEPASGQKDEAPSKEVKETPPPVVSEEPKAIETKPVVTPPESPIKEPPTGGVAPAVEIERIDYYTLSAGETNDRRELSRLEKRLRAAGLQPIVREEKRIVVMHRLVTGCYSTGNEALKHRRELAAVSKDAFVFREGSSACVATGSYKVKETAERERKTLAGKGIAARIAPADINLPYWSIAAGKFPDAAAAEKTMQRVSGGGLKLVVQPVKK
jgi:hypothetical protein